MRESAATNTQVGRAIGLDHTSVSRIRSGKRHPSLAVMLKVAEQYNFPLEKQALAIQNHQYASDLEDCLIDIYGKAEDEPSTGA